jgi:hypothetical protein
MPVAFRGVANPSNDWGNDRSDPAALARSGEQWHN